MSRPTISDVARAAGVSTGAVSFALNDRPGVAPATRARILAVAAELGWTPSQRARALSVSKALAVGLVIARPPETLVADSFFPSFIAGLETVLSGQGHALMLQVAERDDLSAYRRLAAEGRVDGVLLTDLRLDDPRPGLLTELGLPAVVVGPRLDSDVWPAVGVDDSPGVTAAVEHLVGLGHTRIAHVSGPQWMVHGVSRRTAWAAALDRAGLPIGPCLAGDFSAESGAAATRTLLDLDAPPTAVVYANDLMAMAGMSVATSRGLRVPDDLSVTGFDDVELSAYLQPPLTSVSTDVLAWGRAAATVLLDLVHARPTTPVDLAPARLVVRGTTGPSPATKEP